MIMSLMLIVNGTGPDGDNLDDGSEDYGHFNLSGNKFLNDYPNCEGSPQDQFMSLEEEQP